MDILVSVEQWGGGQRCENGIEGEMADEALLSSRLAVDTGAIGSNGSSCMNLPDPTKPCR